MIIYLHGFGGCGASSKATVFRNELEEYKFIAPSLSYIPKLAIDTLKELIASYMKYEKVYLIGSSLGGYYATYLADYFNIPAVLINPAVNSKDTLTQYLGQSINFYDNSYFEWSKKHIEMLKSYEIESIKPKLYFLLSQKGDELLDYMDGVIKFKDAKSIIENNGSHRFDGVEKHIEDIIDFFQLDIKE
ncbi:esterase [Sulfurimonas sp. SAG-AH-194-C20]|nr:YqiA/YcfP family alpha/beta fold hydrolase [Sulfurimonas sp. SAG-AH-194-C20]MDF1879025.1 esterase [Sulfurimonas sp. SAG-AH-194-C20]